MAMRITPWRWKRTMPFQKNCQFMFENPEGIIERCDEQSDFALYFDFQTVGMGIISLCHYHTTWQENIWKKQGEQE